MSTPTSRRVKCLDTGVIFNSVKEAAETYKTSSSCIACCCRGKQKKAGGVRWQYEGQSGKRVPMKESLCWSCHRSDHWCDDPTPCSWAKRFEPVEGWEAEESSIAGHGDGNKLQTYRVISCPLFKPNERRARKHEKGA